MAKKLTATLALCTAFLSSACRGGSQDEGSQVPNREALCIDSPPTLEERADVINVFGSYVFLDSAKVRHCPPGVPHSTREDIALAVEVEGKPNLYFPVRSLGHDRGLETVEERRCHVDKPSEKETRLLDAWLLKESSPKIVPFVTVCPYTFPSTQQADSGNSHKIFIKDNGEGKTFTYRGLHWNGRSGTTRSFSVTL